MNGKYIEVIIPGSIPPDYMCILMYNLRIDIVRLYIMYIDV